MSALVLQIDRETDSAAFFFDSPNDHFHHVSELEENEFRWSVPEKLNIAENYVQGVVQTEVILSTDGFSEKFHLIFRAVPCRSSQGHTAAEIGVNEIKAATGETGGVDNAVFIGICRHLQGPKQIIPSLVWLKLGQQSGNFGRESDEFLAFKRYLRFSQVLCDGKVSAIVGDPVSASNSRDGEIEGGAEILNRVVSVSGDTFRHFPREFQFVDALASLQIFLLDKCAWATLGECTPNGLKIIEVRQGPFNLEV